MKKTEESGSKKDSAAPKAVASMDEIDEADKQGKATAIDKQKDKETAHEGAEVRLEKEIHSYLEGKKTWTMRLKKT